MISEVEGFDGVGSAAPAGCPEGLKEAIEGELIAVGEGEDQVVLLALEELEVPLMATLSSFTSSRPFKKRGCGVPLVVALGLGFIVIEASTRVTSSLRMKLREAASTVWGTGA